MTRDLEKEGGREDDRDHRKATLKIDRKENVWFLKL